MNAVIIAVVVMLALSLARVHVVLALLVGAITGGLLGGLGLATTIDVFSEGLGGSASVALSYGLLGGFAVAIAKTGLPDAMVKLAISLVGTKGDSRKKAASKALIFFIILLISCFSQNLVPIHIAFIPILIPPILKLLNELGVDRRAIATIITFGLTAPYILLPVGFGAIFHDILADNIVESGLAIDRSDIPLALSLPIGGMIIGLLVAVFFTYRKTRTYQDHQIAVDETDTPIMTKKSLIFAVIAILAALVVQLYTDSMIVAALAGLIVIFASGAAEYKKADDIVTDGMKMMAFIGFVMLAASGFAAVIRETGHVELLVEQVAGVIGDNRGLAAALMLIVGLFITMGIGSSFSTIPIIATLFVPLGLAVGFSPMAIIALIGTAGALGDAGAPASDSTLGPTAGLNADGQHDHIWDTCVPTFIHFNVPLLVFGWIAAMIF
ncbi:Na+/H+ antiporter family protein [Desertibacillus haloalkaliphilus]|uniref:Na+/H+ antiporter family protein n=1 Tax=Desertibacillus haloalkaliphilus TaxID=1328930 RepID=UPI001C26C88B|nr:Na+/H+ antiporter family protein [Desertibacillus haloalkaliphilus]MBU8905374.1 Na+/H+ antiporter family protein [Desertibacillus haloalkaliphilus]